MKPNYKKSILNVSNTILAHYGVKHDYPVLKDLSKQLIGKKHIMLMLLDGMGMNILKNIDKKSILRQNVKQILTSVYPPTTVAATTSVLSGVPPYVHGHVGWTQYSRFEETNVTVFTNENADNESLPLKENFREKHLAFETILDKIKQVNPTLITKQLMPSFAVGGYPSFQAQVDALISLNKEESSFSYTYHTEPDSTIHEYGVRNDTVKSLLLSLETEILRLKENLSKDSILIIIADHGLIDVEPVPLYDQKDLLELLKRMPSIEPRSTAFFLKDGVHETFKKRFKKHFGSKFKLYRKQDIYKIGLLGYGEKHPLLDDFIGDYMAITKKRYFFTRTEENCFKAHHAGLSKKEMLVPLIIIKN